MSKTFDFNGCMVVLRTDRYSNNGTLAVQLEEAESGEFFADITVNLNSLAQTDKTAFVDENNLPGVGEWLRENGIARPAGYRQASGFCTYELYQFDSLCHEE